MSKRKQINSWAKSMLMGGDIDEENIADDVAEDDWEKLTEFLGKYFRGKMKIEKVEELIDKLKEKYELNKTIEKL